MTDANTATDDSTDEGAIGVVTAIEKDGDMTDLNDITPADRDDWCDQLKTAINALDGIDEVYGGGFAHQNYQSARLEIVPAHDTPRWGDGYELEPNLRSLSPRLRNLLDDTHYVSAYEVVDKPESIGDGRHDQALYIVEVWFY